MKTAQTYRIWHWAGLGVVGLAGCTGPGFEPPFKDDTSGPISAIDRAGPATATATGDQSPSPAGSAPPSAGSAENGVTAMQAAAPIAPMAGAFGQAPGAAGSGAAPVAAPEPGPPSMAAGGAADTMPAGPMDEGTSGDVSLLGEDAGVVEPCADVTLQPPNGCEVTLDWPLETLLPGSLSLQVQGANEGVEVQQVMSATACSTDQGYYWLVEPGRDEAPSLVLCPVSCALVTDGAALSGELDCSAPEESPAGAP